MFCMNIVREEVKVTVTSMLRLQGQRRLILVPTRKLSQQIKFTSNLHQFPGNPSTIIYQSWILTESTHPFVGYTMQLRSFPGLSTAYHLYRVDRDLDCHGSDDYHSHTCGDDSDSNDKSDAVDDDVFFQCCS